MKLTEVLSSASFSFKGAIAPRTLFQDQPNLLLKSAGYVSGIVQDPLLGGLPLLFSNRYQKKDCPKRKGGGKDHDGALELLARGPDGAAVARSGGMRGGLSLQHRHAFARAFERELDLV